MPELRNDDDGDDVTTSYGSVSVKSNVAFWSKRRDDVTFNQLQKVVCYFDCFLIVRSYG